jgi:hypothetical protein
MDISKFIENGKLKLKVIPHSGRSELKEEDGKLNLVIPLVCSPVVRNQFHS